MPPQYFPADATDAEISAALNAIPAANAASVPKARTWSDIGAAGLAAAKGAPVTQLLESMATSPSLAKTVGGIARVGTTLGGIAHGVATGNVPEMIMSPIAGWNAGKGGYFLGKGAQAAAGVAADVANKVGPTINAALGPLSVAQGGLDLAQMDDPQRRDVGFMGVGKTGNALDNQAAIERVIQASPSMGDAIANLARLGMSEGMALRAVLNVKARGR